MTSLSPQIIYRTSVNKRQTEGCYFLLGDLNMDFDLTDRQDLLSLCYSGKVSDATKTF